MGDLIRPPATPPVFMGVFLRVKLFAKPDLGEYIPAAVALSTGKFRYIAHRNIMFQNKTIEVIQLLV
jgi:hypothetical protein